MALLYNKPVFFKGRLRTLMEHAVIVVWERGRDEKYTDRQYSRGHRWIFDGGLTVPASASPHVVPLPYSVAEYVDPEEAYVASLSVVICYFS